MKSLLILGAGSFAPQVEEIAQMEGYEKIAFLDDNPNAAYCEPVIGKMNDAGKFVEEYEFAIVALGNNQHRMKYTAVLEDLGFTIPYMIHSTAYVSKDAKIGPGCIIREKAIVSRYAELEKAVIINAGAIIDHHCIIGEGTHCLIGAVVRNKVHVEPMTWINANQVVE